MKSQGRFCCNRWANVVLRVVLKVLFLAVLFLPWILVEELDHDNNPSFRFVFDGNSLKKADKDVMKPSVRMVPSNNKAIPPPIVMASCNDLFGSHQLVRNGTCLYHQRLQWLSCEIGGSSSSIISTLKQTKTSKITKNVLVGIHPGVIQGSMGGESAVDVLGRPEEEEQLKFPPGSLVLLSQSYEQDGATIPPHLLDSVDSHMRRFLQSAVTLPGGAVQEKEEEDGSSLVSLTERQRPLGKSRTVLESNKNNVNEFSSWDDDDITLLVRRGNYANPCMALLTMYNVYIVLEHYYDYFQRPQAVVGQQKIRRKRPSLHIIWLDGHAKGDLDPVWHRLFQTKPWHIKQLEQKEFPHGGSNISISNHHNQQAGPSPSTSPQRHRGVIWLSRHVMVVNTMSAIGDEGLGMYQWGRSDGLDANPQSAQYLLSDKYDYCSKKNSTLMHFRDFVLQQYGLLNHTMTKTNAQEDKATPKLLTLLVRQTFYRAHPRSTGETDRTLTNVEADVTYLQKKYPSHSIQVVSFEGMPFQEQLKHIRSTDVLVAVHGAGNIHVLFLPDHATLVEYIPKSFSNRARRFRYLAECLPNNVTYIAKRAWIEGRRKPQQQLHGNGTVAKKYNHGNTNKDLLELRLRPQTSQERENENLP